MESKNEREVEERERERLEGENEILKNVESYSKAVFIKTVLELRSFKGIFPKTVVEVLHLFTKVPLCSF